MYSGWVEGQLKRYIRQREKNHDAKARRKKGSASAESREEAITEEEAIAYRTALITGERYAPPEQPERRTVASLANRKDRFTSEEKTARRERIRTRLLGTSD